MRNFSFPGLPLFVVLGLMAVPVVADADIPSAYWSVAMAHDIPPKIFYAMALTESRRHRSSGLVVRPWPWTVNFAGQGRFFESRGAAWRAIQDYLATGDRSVDIGLMQINWRYHQSSLQSVWSALDPYYNLSVAAEILNRCRERHEDWWDSVGCYHSPSNVSRAKAYRERVRVMWRTLVS